MEDFEKENGTESIENTETVEAVADAEKTSEPEKLHESGTEDNGQETETVSAEADTEEPAESTDEVKSEEAVAESTEDVKSEETAAESTEEKADKVEAAAPQKKKKSKAWLGVIAAAVLVVLIFFAGYGVCEFVKSGTISKGKQNSSVTDPDFSGVELNERPEDKTNTPAGEKMDVPEIIEKVAPTVVLVKKYVKDNRGSYVLASSGSGVIITENGYIITNAHVIADGRKVIVAMNDGEEYEASIVGYDSKMDIGVLKVDQTGMKYAEIGDSDQVRVGEFVISIGNPGVSSYDGDVSLLGSASFGIVSAVDRKITIDNKTLYCIQTDAAINSGSSGGPLVNMYGQVIGINSAKVAVEGYDGLNFAIAISKVKNIIDDIIINGKVVSRAVLGITATIIDDDTAEIYGLEPGAMIIEISKNSDMVYRGVQVQDIITKVNGKEVDSFDSISEILSEFKPGDTVDISVFRYVKNGDNIKFDTTVTLISEADAD